MSSTRLNINNLTPKQIDDLLWHAGRHLAGQLLADRTPDSVLHDIVTSGKLTVDKEAVLSAIDAEIENHVKDDSAIREIIRHDVAATIRNRIQERVDELFDAAKREFLDKDLEQLIHAEINNGKGKVALPFAMSEVVRPIVHMTIDAMLPKRSVFQQLEDEEP